MDHADCHDVRRRRKLADLFHELDLVTDVEKRQRLVEEKVSQPSARRRSCAVARAAQSDAGEIDALTLAAAQGLIVSVGELVTSKSSIISSTIFSSTGPGRPPKCG